jgi:transcriptional regulator
MPYIVEGDPYRNRIELLQGTLDLLILQTLTWRAQYGYGITQAIRAISREALQVDTGSLYPALHRLEREGAVASEWKTSENKQRVKVYRLTAAGRRRLSQERSHWERLLAAMFLVLDAWKAPAPDEA